MSDIPRSKLDDAARRNTNSDSYKNRYFDGKQSAIDEYTGKRIYYTSKGHHTTQTTSNTDHVVPINVAKERYGGIVSNEALKNALNSDSNLAMTSEKLNKVKSDSTNIEVVLKQVKNGEMDVTTAYNMLKKQGEAEIGLVKNVGKAYIDENFSAEMPKNIDIPTTQNINFTDSYNQMIDDIGKKAGNITGKFVNNIDKKFKEVIPNNINKSLNIGKVANKSFEVGVTSALIALTISSCNNLAQIAAGEKSLGEGLKDIALDSGSSFASSAGVSLAQDGVIGICKEYAGKDIAKFVAQELPIAEITTAIVVGRAVLRCLDGEISEEECATEILLSGAGYLAFEVGLACGGPAGAVIASLVVSQISATVLKYQQEKKIADKRLAKFNRIVSDALVALEEQKKVLANFREKEREKLEKAFNTGFEYIQISILQNNVEGIADGLNCILSIFNEKCAFQSLDEFNEFFDDESAVLIL